MILPYKHKTYYWFDDGNSATVFVSNDGREMEPLPLRLDIANHSPSFASGYSGSGAAQLAGGDSVGLDELRLCGASAAPKIQSGCDCRSP